MKGRGNFKLKKSISDREASCPASQLRKTSWNRQKHTKPLYLDKPTELESEQYQHQKEKAISSVVVWKCMPWKMEWVSGAEKVEDNFMDVWRGAMKI